jgi:hypothetical protein
MSISDYRAASPFAPAALSLSTEEQAPAAGPVGDALLSPFAESMTAGVPGDLDTMVTEALLAELEDEEFDEALAALAEEAAARHLRSPVSWSSESGPPTRTPEEAEQYVESVTAEADRMFAELEAYFGSRPVDSLRDEEIAAVTGRVEGPRFEASPFDAQEQFFKKLLDKAKRAVRGVAKIAKKGLAAVGRLLPLGKLFGYFRKLVRPLLDRVLKFAIGKLPASVRPLATQLASRLAGRAPAAAQAPAAPADDQSPGEVFDQQLAELILAPNEAAADQALASYADDGRERSLDELDAARDRLARQLAEADPAQPPTAQMEQFIPVVMAAMPLIRAGVRIVGRERVENFVAGILAKLIQRMVGAEGARLLSRHVARAGLGMLGLEAEDGTTLGTEALVAAAEDTVRQVMSLPAESMVDELVLETEIQDAFAEAAARHLPAAVLRSDVVESESEGEHAIWVMMPRATRPCFRYKKYGRLIPVRVTRPVARSVVLSTGETLERAMLESGVTTWPVDGEMEVYELLEGGGLGHVAAYESADPTGGADEFEELSEPAAALLAGNPRLMPTARWGRGGFGHRTGFGRHHGRRYYRLRFRGRSLRHRRHHLFGFRLDLTSPQPVLSLHLRIGERDAHALAAHLERRDLVQVLSLVRGLVGPAARQSMAQRLERALGRRGLRLAPGTGRRLADQLAEAAVRAVSQQLPAAAATLARAAKDPAPGVTLTFGFTFKDNDAMLAAEAQTPTLAVRAGVSGG